MRSMKYRGSVLAGMAVGALMIGVPEAHAQDWDELAQCESSGDWSINTGNGFYGGLQFHQQTWAGFGGLAYAPRADLASRAQQIDIARKVLAVQGPGAWPACSASTGWESGTTGAPEPTPATPQPAPEPEQSAPVQGDEYEVRSGDTLSEIADEHGTTWQTIYRHNRDVVSDPSLIYPGEVLDV